MFTIESRWRMDQWVGEKIVEGTSTVKPIRFAIETRLGFLGKAPTKEVLAFLGPTQNEIYTLNDRLITELHAMAQRGAWFCINASSPGMWPEVTVNTEQLMTVINDHIKTKRPESLAHTMT